MRFTPISFTCKGCGAPLKFNPASGRLLCEFCGSSTDIESEDTLIQEYDLHDALVHINDNRPKEINKEIRCSSCGVEFTLIPYSVSTNCPYCDTPAIIDFVNNIVPESIIPFTVTQKQAKEIFKQWIGSLWFAPSELKKLIDTDKSLTGYYLPYWTYDANTSTSYIGKRGDIYYVTVRRRQIVNGREQIIEVQEPRVRWTPVSGIVTRYFDDVTIEASETISRKILSLLGSWDTSRLVPFDEKYLSGFESEEYAVGLDSGFEMAQAKMNSIIRMDIRRDIGGDRQQIESVKTSYQNATFKNALFPVWTTHFEYKGRKYYYAINGQNGTISGERPYSYLKITIVISIVLMILIAIGYYSEHFDNISTNAAVEYYQNW